MVKLRTIWQVTTDYRDCISGSLNTDTVWVLGIAVHSSVVARRIRAKKVVNLVGIKTRASHGGNGRCAGVAATDKLKKEGERVLCEGVLGVSIGGGWRGPMGEQGAYSFTQLCADCR